MKKKLFILISILLTICSNQAFAQEFYFKLAFGYAFSHGGEVKDFNGYPYSGIIKEVPSGIIYNVKKVSLLTGWQAQASLGYMIGSHVGIELSGISVIVPKKYTGQLTSDTYGSYTNKYLKSPILIAPEAVVKQDGKYIGIYGKAGFVLPVNTRIVYSETDVDNTAKDEYKAEIQNTFNIGFTGTAGINLNVSRRIKIFVEATFVSLTAYFKELHYKESSGGIPQNYTAPVYYNTNGTSTAINVNSAVALPVPLSNISANAGIEISFGRRSSHKEKTGS